MISAVRDTRLIVAAVLVVLALVTGCTGQPEQQATRPSVSVASAGPETRTSARAPATAAAVGGDVSYRTGKRQVTFTEPAHTGPAGQRLGQRTLVTQIWYPRARGAAGPVPLLLFAPGFLQCPGAYSDLLRAWASAGYVVAAVTFPRTSCHLGAQADEADLVNQPRDMSYVLTRLLALSAQPGNPFSGLLDRHEVGAAGQSDGGDTVAALAASTCCADRRVKAVAVLSGAEWPPMPGRYFPDRVAPMLFTQGTADTINPPWMSLQLYRADRAGARYYLDLFGASHLIPYQGTNPVERLMARVHANRPLASPRADSTVRVDDSSPGVRVITLDRPHRLNAMSRELISDLHLAIDNAAAHEECRVVVITGAGRGFCAGLDLKEPPSHRPGTANISPQSRMHVQQAIAALVPITGYLGGRWPGAGP